MRKIWMQVLGLSPLKNFPLSEGQRLSIMQRIVARKMEKAASLVFAELQTRLCKWLVTPAVAHGTVGVGNVVVRHVGSGLRETWVRIPIWPFISWVTCFLQPFHRL